MPSKSRKKGLTGPIRDAQEKDDPFISGRERKKERRRKSGSKSMKKEDKVETDSYIESGYPKDWVNTLKGSYAKGKKNYPYKKNKAGRTGIVKGKKIRSFKPKKPVKGILEAQGY